MRVHVVAVVLLTVLAGCSGLEELGLDEAALENLSVEDLEERDLKDLDPKNFDTDNISVGSSGSTQYPWGVNESGLHNVTRLYYDHLETVGQEAHVAELWLNVSGESGVVDGTARSHRIRRAADGGFPHTHTVTESGSLGATERRHSWANESVRVTRTGPAADANGTVEFTRSDGSPRLSQRVEVPWLFVSIRYGEYTVTAVEGTGNDTTVTLTADGLRKKYADGSAGVENYEGDLVVDGAGRIHAADISYDSTENATFGPKNVHTDLTFELRSIGGYVDVLRPSWVDEGLDATAS